MLLQNDNDKKNFEKIMEGIKSSKNGETLGTIPKDQQYKGAFMDAWRAHWAKNKGGINTVDVTGPLTYVMAPKSDIELSYIRKASQISSEVFRFAVMIH